MKVPQYKAKVLDAIIPIKEEFELESDNVDKVKMTM